jgi:hypothetical protein
MAYGTPRLSAQSPFSFSTNFLPSLPLSITLRLVPLLVLVLLDCYRSGHHVDTILFPTRSSRLIRLLSTSSTFPLALALRPLALPLPTYTPPLFTQQVYPPTAVFTRSLAARLVVVVPVAVAPSLFSYARSRAAKHTAQDIQQPLDPPPRSPLFLVSSALSERKSGRRGEEETGGWVFFFCHFLGGGKGG